MNGSMLIISSSTSQRGGGIGCDPQRAQNLADGGYGHDLKRIPDLRGYVLEVVHIVLRDEYLLHARTLGFVHPKTGEQMDFTSPLPDDLNAVVEKWRNRLKTQELKETI